MEPESWDQSVTSFAPPTAPVTRPIPSRTEKIPIAIKPYSDLLAHEKKEDQDDTQRGSRAPEKFD
jgi:CxxC motif-containing protein (DUF1111 family)